MTVARAEDSRQRTPAWIIAASLLALLCPSDAVGRGVNLSPLPSLFLGKCGQIVALSRWDTATIYRVPDGHVVHDFTVGAKISAMAMTADETRLALGCKDGTIGVWEIASGANVWSGKWGSGIWGISFAYNGRSLVACGGSSGARVHDADTGKVIRQFMLKDGCAYTGALSPDGTTGVLTSHYRLWKFDVVSGTVVDTGVEARRPVVYSSDGNSIAFTRDGYRYPLLIWKVPMAAAPIDVAKSEYIYLTHIRPHADGSFLAMAVIASGGGGELIQYWPETGQLTTVTKLGCGSGMDFSLEAMMGVITSFDLRTTVVDLRTGKAVLTIDNSKYATFPAPPPPRPSPGASPGVAGPWETWSGSWQKISVVVAVCVGLVAIVFLTRHILRRMEKAGN